MWLCPCTGCHTPALQCSLLYSRQSISSEVQTKELLWVCDNTIHFFFHWWALAQGISLPTCLHNALFFMRATIPRAGNLEDNHTFKTIVKLPRGSCTVSTNSQSADSLSRSLTLSTSFFFIFFLHNILALIPNHANQGKEFLFNAKGSACWLLCSYHILLVHLTVFLVCMLAVHYY